MKRFMPIFLLAALLGCTADELPEPMDLTADCENVEVSYELNIKNIIDNACAYSGCHLNSAPGNYLTFDGVERALENGTFRSRVIGLRDDGLLGMPPEYAPDGRPKELSPEQLQLILCWLEAGYPES